MSIAGGLLSCMRMTTKEFSETDYRRGRVVREGRDSDNRAFVFGTGHAMSFKVCLKEEIQKINIFDTGWGISYFIWWEEDTDWENPMKEGITDEQYERHKQYYMFPDFGCRVDPTSDPVDISKDKDYNALDWLPLSYPNEDQSTIEDIMSETLITHFLSAPARGDRGDGCLILINYKKLDLISPVQEESKKKSILQPFCKSYMELKQLDQPKLDSISTLMINITNKIDASSETLFNRMAFTRQDKRRQERVEARQATKKGLEYKAPLDPPTNPYLDKLSKQAVKKWKRFGSLGPPDYKRVKVLI